MRLIFLDARGDEKQISKLEQPYLTVFSVLHVLIYYDYHIDSMLYIWMMIHESILIWDGGIIFSSH